MRVPSNKNLVVRPRPVLVIEDDYEDFDTVVTAAERSGVRNRLVHAPDAEAARRLLTASGAEPFALVLLDNNLPGMSGCELLNELRSEPCCRALPFVVYTTSSSPSDRDACFAAGASAYHVKPVRFDRSLETLAGIFHDWLDHDALRVPWRVAIVDDNPDDLAEVKALLLRGSTRRYEFLEAETGAEALRFGRMQPPPHCLVLDYDLPDMNAIELLEALPQVGDSPLMPVVVLTGMSDEALNRKLLRAGAQDFIGKDWMTAGSLTRGVENAIERHRATRQLRASEQLNRSLMEGITDSVAVLDLDGRLLHLNGPALTAMKLDELRPLRGRAWWSLWPEPARGQLRQAVARARTEQTVNLQVAAPATPAPIWWDVTISSVRDDPLGPVVRLLVISRDITERKQAEAALRASEERLREIDRRKDEFLAMLGHELRNPLAAIRSAAELIKLSAPEKPRLHTVHAVLERQSAHMTRLIDGLLEVSRIAQGKIALARHALDLREVIQGVLADRRRLVRDSGLELHLELGDEPVWVWADPVRLAQVFDNLIGNAIKFTAGPGTITLTLTLMLAAEQAQAVIRVSDTGTGIRLELIPHIFEPFRQEVQGIARSTGGLGLGLALVRGLVELHEGTVEVHSEGPGTGATFTVRLPLANAPPVDQASEGQLSVASQRLLIVEDNEDAALMLRELLQLRGHTVTIVDTGAEALALLRRQSIDVVLCDIGLPDMSGYDVARAIRQDPALAGLGLVAITGYGQAEDRERTRAVGFDEHLTKPVDLRTLERVLTQLPRGPQRC